jgi:hypothetical protein
MKHRIFPILIFLIFSVATGKAQRDYPISTIFKGDSVVILTLKQSESINRSIDRLSENLRQTSSEVSRLKKQNDSLVNEAEILKKRVVEAENKADSIQKDICFQIDTLKSTIDSIGSWMLNMSVSTSFVYFDWTDSTIKFVDLTLYGSGFNNWTGNFHIVRRAKENEYQFYDYYNWTEPESPDGTWLKVNSNYIRPRVHRYPFRFNFKNKYSEK